MTNPVLQVMRTTRIIDGQEKKVGRGLWMWCPGCDEAHRPQVISADGDLPEGPCWEWDGNELSPTISPSLLVHGNYTCHSFIRNGQWEFLSDCTHKLAGQTVSMVPLPDWLVR